MSKISDIVMNNNLLFINFVLGIKELNKFY